MYLCCLLCSGVLLWLLLVRWRSAERGALPSESSFVYVHSFFWGLGVLIAFLRILWVRHSQQEALREADRQARAKQARARDTVVCLAQEMIKEMDDIGYIAKHYASHIDIVEKVSPVWYEPVCVSSLAYRVCDFIEFAPDAPVIFFNEGDSTRRQFTGDKDELWVALVEVVQRISSGEEMRISIDLFDTTLRYHRPFRRQLPALALAIQQGYPGRRVYEQVEPSYDVYHQSLCVDFFLPHLAARAHGGYFYKHPSGCGYLFVVPEEIEKAHPGITEGKHYRDYTSEQKVGIKEIEHRFRSQVEQVEAIDMAMINLAIDFIKRHQSFEYPPSNRPYYVHALHVASLLFEHTQDQDALLGALLHHVIDKKESFPEELNLLFGEQVSRILQEISFMIFCYREALAYQKPYEGTYFKYSTNSSAKLIRLVDRLHELSFLPCLPLKEQARMAKETRTVFLPEARVLGLRGMVEQLEQALKEGLEKALGGPPAFQQEERDQETYINRYSSYRRRR